MFYVGHLIKAQLTFPHHQLKQLGDFQFIMQRLKQNFEGRCLQQFGYLIQIIPMKDCRGGVRVGQIKVTSQGCLTLLQFDCLCFKPRKGDVVDIFLDYVDAEMVHGKLGAAEVLIPRHRIAGFDFDGKTVSYSCHVSDGSRVAMDIGGRLRVRCIEWIIEDQKSMKIIAEVDQELADSEVMGHY